MIRNNSYLYLHWLLLCFQVLGASKIERLDSPMDPSSKDLETIPANQVPTLSGRRFKVPCYGQAGRDHIGKCRQIF